VAETLAILATPKFAPLFAPGSRAEVPLVAMIPRPAFAKSGPPLRLSGQIDRLAVTDQEVLIVDYKTNRPPPRHLENVPETYLLQLAAYTLALRQIYADRRIGSAIIWTDGPHMMEIPDHTIEAAITRLWRLEPGART
jgi:ATP-dependent helicase/nuclease subunit A